MTFSILGYNTMTDKVKDNPPFSSIYEFLGFFHEHKFNQAGFDFEEESLEKFVEKNDQDPSEVEGYDLKNWSDEFANGCKTWYFMAFSVQHKRDANKIIRKNYDRFEVYQKKD